MLTENALLSPIPSDRHLAGSDGMLLDTRRAALLAWGKGRAYPQLWLKPHLAIGEGLRCWQLVAEKATDEEIGLALTVAEYWAPDLAGAQSA